MRGDEGVGGVHGHVAAPAQQRAVLHAEEVGVALLHVVVVQEHEEEEETEQKQSPFTRDEVKKYSSTWHMSQLGAEDED